MSGGRGIVRIVNGPVSCTVDIDRPLTADEMRALAPLARAAADIAAVFTGASGDRSEPSRSSGCEARSTTTSPEAAMSDTKRAADSKSHRRGLESDGANPSEPADVPNDLLDLLDPFAVVTTPDNGGQQ